MEQEKTEQNTGTATYCLEDDKLRLYVGYVPRADYLRLRAEGWTATPKQSCDFVAVWTPGREETALEFGGGYIGDEDQTPEDRAADRAERFGMYRDKRRAEAGTSADLYDAGPAVIGCQSQSRANRLARKQDRYCGYAVTQWSKAEYWQRRTAGVISNALHKASAEVRRGRILKLEAELRKVEKELSRSIGVYKVWLKVRDLLTTDPEKAQKLAVQISNISGYAYDYQHPRKPDKQSSLWSLLTYEPDPITAAEAAALALERYPDGGPGAEGTRTARTMEHLKNRLIYERMMLDAAGGTAGQVEMIPGGFIGQYQIHKVNRSPITKAVVSVMIYAPRKWYIEGKSAMTFQTVNIQRLAADAYRAPTPEELQAFNEQTQSRKAKEKATRDANPGPKLINPTLADAQKLQAELNAAALQASKYAKPVEVCCITQAEYTEKSKGSYSRYETMQLRQGPLLSWVKTNMYRGDRTEKRPVVCHIRATFAGCELRSAWRVVVITDKPQKPLPDYRMTEEVKQEAVKYGVEV